MTWHCHVQNKYERILIQYSLLSPWESKNFSCWKWCQYESSQILCQGRSIFSACSFFFLLFRAHSFWHIIHSFLNTLSSCSCCKRPRTFSLPVVEDASRKVWFKLLLHLPWLTRGRFFSGPRNSSEPFSFSLWVCLELKKIRMWIHTKFCWKGSYSFLLRKEAENDR